MSLQELISNYGYLTIAVGTFFEGETVLVLGGLAAHRGFLLLPGVIACAFLGAFCGNQLYFHIGRRKGATFLAKRPALAEEIRENIRYRRETPESADFRVQFHLRAAHRDPILAGRRQHIRRQVLPA